MSKKKGPTKKGGGRVEPVIETQAPMMARATPLYIPVSSVGSIIAGLVVIIMNFLELLPGKTQPQYNLVGLVFMTFGFILATQIK